MAGLSAGELTQIQETLAGGKRPRVMFTEAAGQIAGQVGHVVQLDDPRQDEWILVRFGSDVLPFSPADLMVPPRGSSRRKPAEAAAEPVSQPEFKVVREAAPKKVPPSTAVQESTVPQNSAVQPATSTPAPRKPARQARSKPAAAFTVTLSYVEGEWLVGAVQGAKAVAKPYVIKAAEALKMVALLDVPGVQEAVEQILAAERAHAQAQAAKLRAELAEVEAKLAELS